MGKVSSYTTVAAIADADLLYLAQDDSGDFLDRKITGQFLKSLFATAAQGAKADTAVQPAAIADFAPATGFDTMVALTQSAYDALDPVDADTLYFIVDEGS